MGTHVSFIFRGYNPYIGDLKPSFFILFGVQRCLEGKTDSTDTDFLHGFANVRPKDTIVWKKTSQKVYMHVKALGFEKHRTFRSLLQVSNYSLKLTFSHLKNWWLKKTIACPLKNAPFSEPNTLCFTGPVYMFDGPNFPWTSSRPSARTLGPNWYPFFIRKMFHS